jgi:hypothetical protein
LTLKLKFAIIHTDKNKENKISKEKIMKKIELKEITGKEVIKSETRLFGLTGGRNIGVLEFTKEEIKQREHSGIGFEGMKGKTPSISEIKKYIEEKGFKRFNALEVAKEVFERFEISEEEQFQIVENKLPSLETI